MSRPVTIRIYSPYFPYPITEGAFQVAFDQARSLSEMGYDVELVCWKDSASTIARKLSAGARPFPESIRITSLYGGVPSTAAASEWSARAVDPARSGERESRISRLARVVRSLASPLASPETFYFPPAADVRTALPPADLGIYHYSFAYSWLRNGAPERRTAVHFLNLESELSRLQGRVETAGGTRWIHRLNARKLERHEAELADLADELWFVSRRDLARVAATRPNLTARHVAPTFELALLRHRGDQAAAPPAGFGRSVCLGFIGGCHFEPNRASLEWIVTRLAPELERRSFAGRILVVGRGVPARLREAGARYSFFDWLGFVPDVEDFWGSLSFLLMPEVGGSGVRIKLLESMASGVPVIANGAALQALSRDAAEHPLVHHLDDVSAWADLIARETSPRQTRERLAGHDLAGTGLDACEAYRFLPELVGDALAVDTR